MKTKSRRIIGGGVLAVATATLSLALDIGPTDRAVAAQTTPATTPAKQSLRERGEYLVKSVGCHDCHTPWKMGPSGPEPDMTRMLSGHPAQMALPPAPKLPPGPWIGTMAATMTAWSGPWGTSFTANLTPDKETGLGQWTERTFLDAIRSGKHLGRGRPILPPMPWSVYRNFSDQDLKAMFAYLQSVPAIKNKVPEPIVPPVVAGHAGH